MSPKNMLQLGDLRKHEGLSDFSLETNLAFPSLFLQKCWEKVVWSVRESRPMSDLPEGSWFNPEVTYKSKIIYNVLFLLATYECYNSIQWRTVPSGQFRGKCRHLLLFLSRPSPPLLFPKGSCLKVRKLLHQFLQMSLTVWGLSLGISLPLSLNFHPAFFFPEELHTGLHGELIFTLE